MLVALGSASPDLLRCYRIVSQYTQPLPNPQMGGVHWVKTGWPVVWKTWKCQGIWQHQGNVRDFTKSQGNVREKILSGNSCLKPFIVNCIFASIQVFSTSTDMIWVTLNMPSAVEKCRKPSGKCYGISHCLESCHPFKRRSFALDKNIANRDAEDGCKQYSLSI